MKVNSMNKLKQMLAAGVAKVESFVSRNAGKLVAAGVAMCGMVSSALATDPDATVIATNAQTAFGVVAPITISIGGFYVILKIAKRVAH